MDRTKKSDQVREYTYQDLVKLGPTHPYWFENPITQKKVYRKGKIKISTGTVSIKQAKEIVQAELDRRAGLNPTTMKRRRLGVTNPLISDVWSDMVSGKTALRAPATMEKYDQSWKHAIAPFWSDMTVDKVTQQTELAFETWYMTKRSTKQFFNVRKHLGMFFRYLETYGYIQKVPKVADLDQRINKIVKREKVGRVYTDAEQKSLIRAVTGPYERYQGSGLKVWPWQLRAHVGILLGLQAGVRKMEACSVRLEHIDLDGGYVTVWSQKNGRWRKVPIGPELVAAIGKYIASTKVKSPWLFPMPSKPTEHMSSQMFDHAWFKAKKRAALTGKARFHDLRHTFATRTAKEKWSVIVACDLLDMSVKIYQRTYTHTDHTDVRAELMRTFGWIK